MTENHDAPHAAGATPPANFYEQIFSSFHTGVIVVNRDDTVVVANPAACFHLGIPESNLRPGVRFDSLEGAEAFAEVLHELKKTRKPVLRREIILEQNGRKQIVGASASMLQGAEKYNGAIFVFTNLTVTRSNERAAAINRQLAQIGKLTGGVVHELRNPLSVISGMAELLMRKLGPDHDVYSFASMIFEEAQGMEKLVAKFLSFAKPFELDFRPCTPNQILERAKKMNEGLIASKNIELSIQGASTESPIFRADTEKTSLALSNLLNNALEATPDGGKIELRCTFKEGSVFFRVTDSGPGIQHIDRESLANPFYSRKAESTGLGLSITNRIVTAHGGHLDYGNREVGGAWFEFSLPAESTFDLLADTLENPAV